MRSWTIWIPRSSASACTGRHEGSCDGAESFTADSCGKSGRESAYSGFEWNQKSGNQRKVWVFRPSSLNFTNYACFTTKPAEYTWALKLWVIFAYLRLETPSRPGVIPNQAFTGLPNRRCLQTHTQIEFKCIWTPMMQSGWFLMMIHSWLLKVTRWNHVGHAFVLCSNAIGFALREPWSQQWGPHWWKGIDHGISWNSPFFFSLGDNPRMSKCGRCSDFFEGNETSHLKGVYRQQHSFVAVGHCHWSSSETTKNFVPSREYVPNSTATMLALQAASFVWPRNFVLDLWGGVCDTTLWLSCEVSNFEASFSLLVPVKLQIIKDIAAEQWRRGLAAWSDFWTCF